MIKELFENDLLLIKKNGNFKDYSDYFATLFDRQESFDKPFVDTYYYGLYSPDRHSGSMKSRSFPMNGGSWSEFQLWIDTAYTLATPFNVWNTGILSGQLSLDDATVFHLANGAYQRPAGVTTMVASDGHVLATGLVTDASWETAYNTLFIPYERSINSSIAPTLRYIKNLVQYGDRASWFRTSTLKFDGTST